MNDSSNDSLHDPSDDSTSDSSHTLAQTLPFSGAHAQHSGLIMSIHTAQSYSLVCSNSSARARAISRANQHQTLTSSSWYAKSPSLRGAKETHTSWLPAELISRECVSSCSRETTKNSFWYLEILKKLWGTGTYTSLPLIVFIIFERVKQLRKETKAH